MYTNDGTGALSVEGQATSLGLNGDPNGELLFQFDHPLKLTEISPMGKHPNAAVATPRPGNVMAPRPARNSKTRRR